MTSRAPAPTDLLDVGGGAPGLDPFGDVVGQDAAVVFLRGSVSTPVHAYLLAGPRGSGKRPLAVGFAAALLADGLDAEGARRAIQLALAEQHPDLVVVEPEGTLFRKGDPKRGEAGEGLEVLRAAAKAPTEGRRKVVVAVGIDQASAGAAEMLLKTVEEPGPSTVFLFLVDDVVPDIATIASRCVRVDLGPVAPADVAARLEAEGVPAAIAADVAAISGGDLPRARVLAGDPSVAERQRLWMAVPDEVDGTGATAVRLADTLLSAIEAAAGPLATRQAGELEELEARVERYGERGAGRAALVRRHKREERLHRADELRFGLAVLAGRYRDALVSDGVAKGPEILDALEAITATNAGLVRNPSERLQLIALFLRLPRIGAAAVR